MPHIFNVASSSKRTLDEFDDVATFSASTSNKRIRLSEERYGASSKRTLDDLDDVATFSGSTSSKRIRLSEEGFGELTVSASYSRSSGASSSQLHQTNSKSKGKGKAREDPRQETGDVRIAQQQTHTSAKKAPPKPRKKKRQTNEQQQKRNQKARDDRAQDGSTYQRRMTDKRDGLHADPNRNTDIATVLSDIFRNYATRFQTVRRGINASMDSTLIVKSVVKSSRQYDNISPISDDSAVWAHLQPVFGLLADCAMKPFHFDVDFWVNAGVLVQAGNLVNNEEAEYYVRVIKFPDTTALCKTICRYISAYPADMSVAVLWLALIGHPVDDIKAAVRSSLESRGYVLAATELLARLDEDDLESLNLGIEKDTPVYFPYAGYSIGSSPEERLAEDKYDCCRRFPNFFEVLGSDVIVSTYHFAALNWPAPLLFSHRTDRIIGHIESVCIDSLCISTLNSRRGGIPDAEYLPPPDIVAVVSKTLGCCGPVVFTEEDRRLTNSIRAAQDDESKAFQRSIPKQEYKPISSRAFEHMKRMTADVVRKVHGRVVTVDLGKDIPFEESSGQSGGVYDEDIGEGLRLQRHMMSLIYPEIPTTGSLQDGTIAQFFGPFVDFWRLVGEGYIHWSAFFLSRYLSAVQPLVIVAFSNPVNKMLRGQSLATIWDRCKNDVIKKSFLDGQSPAKLSEFCRDTKKSTLPEYKGDGFLNVVGNIARIRYGREPWHRCLTIASRDPGSVKYDPILALLRLLLQYLVLAKAELLKRVAARRQATIPFPAQGDKTSVEAWLSAVQMEVEKHTAEHGLADELQRTVTKLRQREKVMGILRQAKLDDGLPVPVGKTRGPREPSRHHDDAYYHAAPAGKEREAQYQLILEREGERVPGETSTIIPFGMSLEGHEFRNHFFSLADGTYLISSRNAYGTTPEAQASAAANRASLVKHNVLQGQLRDKERDVMEHKALPGLLTKALEDVVDYETHALNTPTAIADAWRWTTCGKCNGVLVALVKNHKHRCMQDNCEEQVITAAQFPGLQRILYPHDIFGNAKLAPLLKSTPDDFGLVSISVRDFLQEHIDLLPPLHSPLENIPPELAVLVHPSYDNKFRLVLCIDAAYPQLTTCKADPDATDEDDRNRPWNPKTFQPIWNAIKDGKKLYVSKCANCGFLGIGTIKKPKHKGEGECSSSSGKNWKAVYTYGISSFFEFPCFWARRLLYYGRVEGRVGGFDILMW